MALLLICLAIAGWLLYSGLKFYRNMDWNEAPEPSPDFQQMHKRQAELLHIQELLQQAHEEGKVSKDFMAELNRFCDREIEHMKVAETAWKNRKKTTPSP